MIKYLLLLTLMMPAFLVEQAEAGRDRQGKQHCYLIRGLVNNQFIHGYRYLSREAAQLFTDGGLTLQRKPKKNCDAFLDSLSGDDD